MEKIWVAVEMSDVGSSFCPRYQDDQWLKGQEMRKLGCNNRDLVLWMSCWISYEALLLGLFGMLGEASTNAFEQVSDSIKCLARENSSFRPY